MVFVSVRVVPLAAHRAFFERVDDLHSILLLVTKVSSESIRNPRDASPLLILVSVDVVGFLDHTEPTSSLCDDSEASEEYEAEDEEG
jgi:hypothetical protein